MPIGGPLNFRMEVLLMTPYPLLLGLVLATSVGVAAAATSNTDSYANGSANSTATRDAAKASTDKMSGKMSSDKTDKTSADKMSSDKMAGENSASSTAASANATERHHAARARHSHKTAMARRETVSPGEKTYRSALRQCAKDRDQSQRDNCLDSAIEQHAANG